MNEPRKIILDTDLGPDCDDCGALAILDKYHKEGKAELLGVTHCTSDLNSVNVIAAINEWFGVDVPIGQTDRKGFFDGVEYQKYTKPVSDEYLKTHEPAKYESAVPLMRRLLAEHRDVTLVFIGPLNNMKELLVSEADEYSPLCGIDLVKQSVSTVVSMGGYFEPPFTREFNIECDIPSAQYTTEHCPVPIVYCGFEAGRDVITGASLESCNDTYPVKQSYRLYIENSFLRPSWDLVTVYYALEPRLDRWIVSEECKIRFNDDATSAVSEGTGARFVKYADERELEQIINGIIG
ncbi:MAG: hypothetical protein E7638_04250 [Ruminococcaceae bacterium]|nr:hypothetical protein [Oscillospiraceae bacterium]